MSSRHETCPYRLAPADALWTNVGSASPDAVTFDIRAPFQIAKTMKIMTAGSCFAQHVARRLRDSGYDYFIAENCPSIIPDEVAAKFGYRVFSARYGNIYTTVQLLQLLERAYGLREPVDAVWRDGDRYLDPLRPHVQPNGFASAEELSLDRLQHLAAVRRLVEESDVFVFTLGLTEAWADVRDGTVYPVCPGCGVGVHDANRHKFVNFGYRESYDALRSALELMWARNERLKIILTVSPVPLMATAETRNVIVSTSYSKSVLRAVADDICALRPSQTVYYPSYEIVTGAFSRGAYFESDLRTVRREGVDHVMRVFFQNFAADGAAAARRPSAPRHPMESKGEAMANLICDEEIALAGLQRS